MTVQRPRRLQQLFSVLWVLLRHRQVVLFWISLRQWSWPALVKTCRLWLVLWAQWQLSSSFVFQFSSLLGSGQVSVFIFSLKLFNVLIACDINVFCSIMCNKTKLELGKVRHKVWTHWNPFQWINLYLYWIKIKSRSYVNETLL